MSKGIIEPRGLPRPMGPYSHCVIIEIEALAMI
jgi:hypothetical protein